MCSTWTWVWKSIACSRKWTSKSWILSSSFSCLFSRCFALVSLSSLCVEHSVETLAFSILHLVVLISKESLRLREQLTCLLTRRKKQDSSLLFLGLNSIATIGIAPLVTSNCTKSLGTTFQGLQKAVIVQSAITASWASTITVPFSIIASARGTLQISFYSWPLAFQPASSAECFQQLKWWLGWSSANLSRSWRDLKCDLAISGFLEYLYSFCCPHSFLICGNYFPKFHT